MFIGHPVYRYNNNKNYNKNKIETGIILYYILMLPTIDVFPYGDYIIWQNDRERGPCVYTPRGFELSQLKPTWVDDVKWNFMVDALVAPINTTPDIVQNAYLFLSFYEDLIAIYDDRRCTIATSHFAIIWEDHENPVWRSIVEKAILTDIRMEGPSYDRPSLCLLSKEWLDSYDFDFDPPPYQESMTFRTIELFPPLEMQYNQWTLRETKN